MARLWKMFLGVELGFICARRPAITHRAFRAWKEMQHAGSFPESAQAPIMKYFIAP
jgi:hypothetical protein